MRTAFTLIHINANKFDVNRHSHEIARPRRAQHPASAARSRRVPSCASIPRGPVGRPRFGPTKARTLLDIAIENAREGLAGETIGALLAQHQAQHAVDDTARRTVQNIARDETRRAAPAWAVHDFCAPRLDREGQREVAAAFEQRWAELSEAEFAPRGVQRQAGLPSPKRQRHLLAALRRELTLNPPS